MSMIKPRTLSGFMELLPAKQAQMEKMMQILRETYALYGFATLDTPIIGSRDSGQKAPLVAGADRNEIITWRTVIPGLQPVQFSVRIIHRSLRVFMVKMQE